MPHTQNHGQVLENRIILALPASPSPARRRGFGQKTAFLTKIGVFSDDKVIFTGDKVILSVEKVISSIEKVILSVEKTIFTVEKVIFSSVKVFLLAEKMANLTGFDA